MSQNYQIKKQRVFPYICGRKEIKIMLGEKEKAHVEYKKRLFEPNTVYIEGFTGENYFARGKLIQAFKEEMRENNTSRLEATVNKHLLKDLSVFGNFFITNNKSFYKLIDKDAVNVRCELV